MNESYITVVGRVVADPQSRTTRTGVPFAAFRLASTVRRISRESGQYEDAGTSFYNVSAFRALGANVANSLKKGEPVVVHGRLRVNQWMRSDNTHATSVEIDAYSVGHDLSWGTTELHRVARAQLDQNDRMADEGVQDVMASFEGEAPVSEQSFEDYDPGDLAHRASASELDADTDAYVTEGPEQEGSPQLSTV